MCVLLLCGLCCGYAVGIYAVMCVWCVLCIYVCSYVWVACGVWVMWVMCVWGVLRLYICSVYGTGGFNEVMHMLIKLGVNCG